MSLRKQLYPWHSWAGFQLAMLSVILRLSGTLAVVRDEIGWLLDGERDVRAFDGEPDWNVMYRNAQTVAHGWGTCDDELGRVASHGNRGPPKLWREKIATPIARSARWASPGYR